MQGSQNRARGMSSTQSLTQPRLNPLRNQGSLLSQFQNEPRKSLSPKQGPKRAQYCPGLSPSHIPTAHPQPTQGGPVWPSAWRQICCPLGARASQARCALAYHRVIWAEPPQHQRPSWKMAGTHQEGPWDPKPQSRTWSKAPLTTPKTLKGKTGSARPHWSQPGLAGPAPGGRRRVPDTEAGWARPRRHA